MARRKKIKSLIIVGRTYWVRGNGYTKSSAEIFANGDFLAKVGDDGGGGSGTQFLCQAQKWLIDNGHLPAPERANGGYTPLWRQCEESKIKLAYTSSAVAKRAEL